MNRGRREEKPFILKAGFALFLSLAGFFAARRHSRRRGLSLLPPPPLPLLLSDRKSEPGLSAGVLDEELPIHLTEEVLAKIMPRAPVTLEENQFPTSESSEEEDEFPCLIQKGPETVPETIPAAPLTDDFEIKESAAMEEEIKNLRNLVQYLQERGTCLEMQLLEYHGLKEQEASVRELQNRLKISATETKLLSLKIESLKVENLKLRAEASDYSRVSAELEMHRKKITFLENKLKSVGELAKEKIAALHARITELREKERKDLEDAVEVEKKSEHILNPSVIRSPDSVLKSLESETLEEQNQLREENENLKKKLEQLQTDRCEDVEELVYLRWVNACLRYELRNYQPPPGRAVARDLSRCLSPKSEQKAKQLILEYSNSGVNLNRSSLMDFDLDDYSSQASSEESNETSLDSSKTKSSKSSKLHFFGKLKKLALGKGHNADKMMKNGSSDINSERRASVSTCVIEESGRKSFDCTSGFSVEEANNSHGLSRSSLDIQNIRRLKPEELKRCNSDLGAVYYDHKRVLSLDGNLSSSTCSSFVDNQEIGDPEKVKLKKFAQVFKDSKGSLKFRR